VDIIEGVTMKQEWISHRAGSHGHHRAQGDLHPQIVISDERGEPLANYPIPSGAHVVVNEGDKIVRAP